MQYIYECKFVIDGKQHYAMSDPHDGACPPGLSGFVDGFWVDHNLKYTYNRDHYYLWIPAHKVEYIKRIVPDEEAATGTDD